MASRTKLIGVQYYDSDGGLDWFWCGSDWLSWRDHQLKKGLTEKELKQRIRDKFERALDSAFASSATELKDD